MSEIENKGCSEVDLRKIEVLKFYRAEVMHEFALLGHRVGWFVMVQSFLLTAFAVAMGYKLQGFNWLAGIIIPIIGIITSLLVMPGINGASDTIDLWISKHRKLLIDNKQLLCDYIIYRDECNTLSDDKLHIRSYFFQKYIPWLTLIMWFSIKVLFYAIPIKIY